MGAMSLVKVRGVATLCDEAGAATANAATTPTPMLILCSVVIK
jgi:hypothetical protein